MSTVYSDFVDFVVAGHTPAAIIEFQPSEAAKHRVAELISQEKGQGLSADEQTELDHYLHVEHIMRLAKARARQQLAEK